MIVVDTSVLVGYLRGDATVRTFLERESARGTVLVPALAAGELWKGAKNLKQKAAVEALLQALEVDPMSAAIARLAADLHLLHKTAGRIVPGWDLLIASHAIHHDCPLATRDVKQGTIDGLDVFEV